jgi:hypothetical protein
VTQQISGFGQATHGRFRQNALNCRPLFPRAWVQDSNDTAGVGFAPDEAADALGEVREHDTVKQGVAC